MNIWGETNEAAGWRQAVWLYTTLSGMQLAGFLKDSYVRHDLGASRR